MIIGFSLDYPEGLASAAGRQLPVAPLERGRPDYLASVKCRRAVASLEIVAPNAGPPTSLLVHSSAQPDNC